VNCIYLSPVMIIAAELKGVVLDGMIADGEVVGVRAPVSFEVEERMRQRGTERDKYRR